jgi:hypothetical protein
LCGDNKMWMSASFSPFLKNKKEFPNSACMCVCVCVCVCVFFTFVMWLKWSVLISWRFWTFFSWDHEPLWLAHHKQILKLCRLPNVEVFTSNIKLYKSQYWPLTEVSRGQCWAKHMGQSEVLIENMLRNRLGTLGTCWELVGISIETNTYPKDPTLSPKKKKTGPLGACWIYGIPKRPWPWKEWAWAWFREEYSFPMGSSIGKKHIILFRICIHMK